MPQQVLANETLSHNLYLRAQGGKLSNCDGGAGTIYTLDGTHTELRVANDASGTHEPTPLPAPLPEGLDMLEVRDNARVWASDSHVLESTAVYVAERVVSQ